MQTVDGPIEAVTLYRSAAVVTRTTTLTLAEGEQAVEIVGLPVSLMDASVRVEAQADSGEASIVQVRIGLYVAPRDDLPEPVDEVELKKVRRARDLADERLQGVRSEQRRLSGLQAPDRPNPPEGQSPGPSPLTARLALDGFVSEAIAQRADQAHQIEKEIEDLERQEKDLEQRLRLASDAGHVKNTEVTKSAQCRVRVNGGPVQVRLSVRYQIPGARWVPTYQVRVNGDQADIVLRALVAQRSGEDWNNVRISVSTAEPVSWTTLPKMTALRIGRQQAYEPPSPVPVPPPAADQLFADFEAQRARIAAPRAAIYDRALPMPSPLASFDDEPAMVGAAFGGAPLDEEVMAAPEVELARAMDVDDLRIDKMAEAATMAPMPAGAPAPAPAPAKAMRRSAAKRMVVGAQAMRKTKGRERSREVSAAAFEAQIFEELELQGPDSSAKGTLIRVDREVYYRRTAERAGRPLAFDPKRLVDDAVTAAQALLRQPVPTGCERPEASSGRFDYTYPAESTVDVPSDGAFHSIPLSRRTGACKVTYVTVPRSDANVYRQAQLENPELSPLLPGPAEIYVDGEYVMTAVLPIVAGRGHFELGLGVEQSVRCARNVRFREARSSDKVVATNDLYHELRYELVNDLDRDVSCEVRERVPIPDQDAEVVIEERDVTPKWEPYDQAERKARIDGGRRWRVTIPARGRSELAATYVIRIYANHQIAGGNRREQ